MPRDPLPPHRAPDWNRTSDLWYRKPTLYPLSYGGVPIETTIPARRSFTAVAAARGFASRSSAPAPAHPNARRMVHPATAVKAWSATPLTREDRRCS